MAFGSYTPERAEQIKTSLDVHAAQIEHHIRRIRETVPFVRVAATDELSTCLRAHVEFLHEVVDQRTDSEASV